MKMMKKDGKVLEYNGIKYVVGDGIIAAKGTPYEGLYGHITAICCDDADKETENETPDIYCDFEHPVLREDIQKTEEAFSKESGIELSIGEIPLDEVVMAPDMIMPLAELERGRTFVVYAVISEWSDESNMGFSRRLFTNYDDAVTAFKVDLAKEQSSGMIRYFSDAKDFMKQEGKDYYECYLEGCYCDCRYSIRIQCENVKASENDFASIQEGWTLMDKFNERELPVGTKVIFKNQLEASEDDIRVGVVRQDSLIDCQCGYSGRFKPEDVKILKIISEGEKDEKL